MDPETYVAQFNIIGNYGDIHCENLSHMLYSTILNKFKVTMTKEEYGYFKEFQERIFDLVENLRELDGVMIVSTLEYLHKTNVYLVDIVIMLWSLPRTDNYLSKRIYNRIYKEYIQKFNHKMVDLIHHETVRNFCIETLTKTNNVPVHCIDYLWFYMVKMSMEFTFYNSENGHYIGFITSDDEYIEMGLNMEYLLGMGLGQVTYPDDPANKGSFRNFLKNIITNPDAVRQLLLCKSKDNFRTQLINISHDPVRYFGDVLKSMPEGITAEIV